MPITVKRLIAELEKIENKYLEVEVYLSKMYPINGVKESNYSKKVLIYADNSKDDI